MSNTKEKKLYKSPYAVRLFKKHVAFTIAFVFFVVLFFSFIPFQVQQYVKLKSELGKLQREIVTLQDRLDTMRSYTELDLTDLVLLMNTLYPAEEDKFSIFTAMDNIQTVTGIEIENLSSPFSGKNLDTVAVTVKASASDAAFREFLAHHKFRSGRFMTVKNISYNHDDQSLNFTANFYSKRIDFDRAATPVFNPSVRDRAIAIQKEVDMAGLVQRDVIQEEETIDINYSSKGNPFEE